MRGQVSRLALVQLETLTPLHIGAGQGGGKPLEDQVLGRRPIPTEYRPSAQQYGSAEVVKIKRIVRERGKPYIPGSSLRGWLRGLYTGALEAAGVRNSECEAEKLFGSTNQAGAIALNDLLPDGSVSTFRTRLVRYMPATTAAGGRRGRSPRDFAVELVDAKAHFSGEASYAGDALEQVLTTIFTQSSTLTQWLRTGQPRGSNPETAISGSPINNNLFQYSGKRWTITWKLGRYAKSYAKALSHRRQIRLPHAYYLVQGTNEVPGWVQVTFDLAPPGEAEFRLNEWNEEEG